MPLLLGPCFIHGSNSNKKCRDDPVTICHGVLQKIIRSEFGSKWAMFIIYFPYPSVSSLECTNLRVMPSVIAELPIQQKWIYKTTNIMGIAKCFIDFPMEIPVLWFYEIPVLCRFSHENPIVCMKSNRNPMKSQLCVWNPIEIPWLSWVKGPLVTLVIQSCRCPTQNDQPWKPAAMRCLESRSTPGRIHNS